MKNKINPPPTLERIQSLDVLRGFSLLGILLVNMIGFHSPINYYNPYEWWKYDDLNVYMWIDVLVQASFYPIFAMMFGYGMVIMQERSKLKGNSFSKIMVRRLAVLLLFGIIHAFLIWHGDILITYAIIGLLLLPLLRLSGPLLISIGAGVYFLPQLMMGTLLVLLSFLDTSTLADFTDIINLQQSVEVYANGTFLEITKQRFHDWSYGNSAGSFIVIIFMILPLMMIGAGAAKLKWLEKANNQRKKWLTIFVVFLILGLAVKMLPILFKPSISIQYIQDMIGGPLLAICYIALIVLVMSNSLMAKILKPLASAGRMSITLYLTQSLIGTLIFYQYGLGLYDQISMRTGTWLALAIYVIQVITAELWLSKFKYGPVEKLWRTLTYGRK